MRHIVEVDQSNKIEDSGTTYIACCSHTGLSCCIKISFQVKQIALSTLRQQGKTKKTAALMLFAACVYLLLEEKLEQLQDVILDNEYDGRQADIKGFLMRYMQKKGLRFRANRIQIRSIGKKSPAHQLAWEAYRGKKAVDWTVTKNQILDLLQ